MTADGLQFKFRKDGEGNYGFLGADGSLIPFKRSPVLIGSISGNGTLSATSISEYNKLTEEDFILCVTNIASSYIQTSTSVSWFKGQVDGCSPSLSYDPSTGTITLTGLSLSHKIGGGSGTGWTNTGYATLTANVYCIA